MKLLVELFGKFEVVRIDSGVGKQVIDFQKARFKGSDLLFGYLCFHAYQNSRPASDSAMTFKKIETATNLNDVFQTLVGLRDVLGEDKSRKKGEGFFLSKAHVSTPDQLLKSYVRVKTEHVHIDVQDYRRLIDACDPG